MSPPERRLVVAFVVSDERAVQDAMAALRRVYPREKVELDSAGATGSPKRPYSQLRMPDEAMLSAWLPVSELAEAVQILQSAHARSIFLTGGGIPAKNLECNVQEIVDHKGLLKALDNLEANEAGARDYLAQSVGLGHPASPAAQWVLDNAYLVRLGIKEIRSEVHRALRRMPSSHLVDLIGLSRKFLNQTGNRISDSLLRDFLTEVQVTRELDSEQLWSFPLMVRIVLIEELVALSCRCSRIQQLREEAFLWADRIAHSSAYDEALLKSTIRSMEYASYASDRSFTVALAEQLQEQEIPLKTLQVSIEARLGASLSELVRAEHQRESKDSLMAASAFGSLRTISQINYRTTFEAVNLADAELWKDPSGIYPQSDFNTRDRCRLVVSELARRAHLPESRVARIAVGLAESAAAKGGEQQLPYYLIGDGIGELERALDSKPTRRKRIQRALRRNAVPIYLGSMILLTSFFTLVALDLAWDAGIRQRFLLFVLGLLVAFPLSELAVQALNSLVTSIFPAEFLPKMDFHGGVPDDAATLLVVPMMLTCVEDLRRELEKLEVRFLANRLDKLTFSLFADFTDAPQREADSDEILLYEAKKGIAWLNRKYGENRFVLFHRPRTWSESEQAWIGRERKRGKLEELNAYLAGEGDSSIVVEGSVASNIRYVITLDADTQLPPGVALRLIETIAHPMNRVEIDERTGVRRKGYTIIQPRVSIALPGASNTRFSQIFSDAQGTDPYSLVVSDAHQELFSEAMFHGKAIYDVAAFHKILGHRFPAETLLSHDLIEGAHVGVALASDVELLETLPSNYPAFARRQHRWIRGDWQIAPWATPRVPGPTGKTEANALSIINRWRILDNLRRSLVPMASLLLLAFGWFLSVVPTVWSIVLAVAVVTPALVPVLDRWSRHLDGTVYGWRGALDDLKRAFVSLAFLPHQAYLNTDAIVRALHRTMFSRRNVLEWQTAADDSGKDKAHDATYRQMMVIAGCSAAALIILAFRGAFGPTFLFLGLWISAPWLMRWLGRATTVPRRERIGRDDTTYLRGVARSTWRYFDDLIGPDTNWLPPDNSQLALRVEVAQRTSPTNIGLWLNAAQAARDFGYLTTDEFVRRCVLSFETIGKLERYEGHLLNWYDTRSLAPLPPRYVSTVDSGNLIASLWVLARGCDELAEAPILNQSLEGLGDAIDRLRSVAGKDPSLSVALEGLRSAVREGASALEVISRLRLAAYYIAQLRQTEKWQAAAGDEKTYWAMKLAAELESWVEVIERYLRWIEVLGQASDDALFTVGPSFVQLRRDALRDLPSLRTLSSAMPQHLAALLTKRNTPELRPELATWLDAVQTEYLNAKRNASEMDSKLRALSDSANRLASEINMKFLYDPDRRLFGTGYTVGAPLTFGGHYDLLASECRLASLVAIAKGEVPVEHWFVLGRTRIATPSRQALMSWSGTMFEYLMPVLFTETFENSLLAEATAKAVETQIVFGEQKKLPWGVSECAYSALDSNQIYQYRAFGIPGLAMDPDADAGPVVAPYATALALMVDPIRAVENLHRLEKEGASGSMGFYDAIDYTRPRREGKPGVVIFTYMVHHQAMTLLSLSNVLSRHPVQRRFHSDLRIRAIEPLLCERIPITRVEAEKIVRVPKAETPVTVQERIWTSRTALPHVHLNSNGRYSLMVSSNGGGYSKWNGIDITRWRSDTARDPWGSFLWIRDVRSGGAPWSPCLNPAGAAGEGAVTFTADHAEFRRQVNELEARLDIGVATEDDAELRRLRVANRSIRRRQVEITTYIELSLSSHAADCAHPAFAKMFVETEAPERGVLIAHRRQRSEEDPQVWVACVLTGAQGGIEFDTDRSTFVGRGQDGMNPAAMRERLAGNTGAVLDPIFSFRFRATLEPRERCEMAIVTLVASSRDDLMKLVRKYQGPESLAHAFEMGWTRAQLEFRYLRIGAAQAHRFEELAGHLLYPSPMFRPSPARLARSKGSQNDLWKYSISGDTPILVVTAADLQAAGLVRELILAHAYWRMSGLDVDLVIMNQEEGGYQTPLHDLLTRLVHVQAEDHRPGAKSGKIYLLNARDVPEQDRELLLSSARVVLGGHLGPLQQQLLRSVDSPAIARVSRKAVAAAANTSLAPIADLKHFNGVGGFSSDGREYVIELGPQIQTPAPWANVLANENFGSVVTEGGLGFTWNVNSQRNRLTPWHNDPVSDPQSEIVYLRDDESGAIWNPTPLPVREGGSYRVRHGQGYSSFEHTSQAISQLLTVFVAVEAPVKICVLRLTNLSTRARSLTVTHYVEWVLGSVREQQQVNVKSKYDTALGIMTAKQTWTLPFDSQVAFCSSSPAASSCTGDRIAFFGGTSPSAPAALDAHQLDNRVGGGLDPCSALQVKVIIPPGGEREVVFVLGQADSEEKAVNLAQQFRAPASAARELDAVRKWWDQKLGVVQVSTPSSTTDLLMNRWLLYQSMACRFFARSAFYQSGGAMGFRDQLQDCIAFLYAAPELTRAHIVKAASRQFTAGDVQHWWHEESGMGVRTRCSDDMLWLPMAVAQYVERTGDAGILDENVPFLDGPELGPGEHERLFTPSESIHEASVWEHCRLAIEHASQSGPHGLPLMGTGDWNDGMNLVGAAGKGESVWLAWFLLKVLHDWIELAKQRDPALVALWSARSEQLRKAVESTCWDGDWYLRAFFDNGSPVGSKNCQEDQIDVIAQAWSVLSGHADPERASRAVASAEQRLVHPDHDLIQLLTPPFDVSQPHPGYIMGYPPGVRENGGQYTHGALWLAQAHAQMGQGSAAVRLLQMMNPAERTRSSASVSKYRGEPYAVAADVSFSPGHVGRSGWTWYTGSAGWMYRIWLEDVLGFQLKGDRLRIAPAIPTDWPAYELTYRFKSSTYRIVVTQMSGPDHGGIEIVCDGKVCRDGVIDLIDDGKQHTVAVAIGVEALAAMHSS